MKDCFHLTLFCSFWTLFYNSLGKIRNGQPMNDLVKAYNFGLILNQTSLEYKTRYNGPTTLSFYFGHHRVSCQVCKDNFRQVFEVLIKNVFYSQCFKPSRISNTMYVVFVFYTHLLNGFSVDQILSIHLLIVKCVRFFHHVTRNIAHRRIKHCTNTQRRP